MLPAQQGWVLDLGPEPKAELSRLAISRGYTVIAVGLEPIQRHCGGLTFICADLMMLSFPVKFDWVLNISTIEHFGLAGRYGITEDKPDHDLDAMRKLLGLLWPTGRMILTIPVGMDAVFKPWHRVYGPDRLPKLLEGWKIVEQNYWAKLAGDRYEPVSRAVALAQAPLPHPFYYGVGTFVLEVA